MNTFGLGREVNTFGLGIPYAGLIIIPEREIGGRKSRNPFIQILSNAEIEALQEQPELLNSIQLQDDEDVTEFIVNVITRGLL